MREIERRILQNDFREEFSIKWLHEIERHEMTHLEIKPVNNYLSLSTIEGQLNTGIINFYDEVIIEIFIKIEKRGCIKERE